MISEVKNIKNNGPKLINNKNINFLSFKLNLIFDFKIKNDDNIKKGISIPICLIANIDGKKVYKTLIA